MAHQEPLNKTSKSGVIDRGLDNHLDDHINTDLDSHFDSVSIDRTSHSTSKSTDKSIPNNDDIFDHFLDVSIPLAETSHLNWVDPIYNSTMTDNFSNDSGLEINLDTAATTGGKHMGRMIPNKMYKNKSSSLSNIEPLGISKLAVHDNKSDSALLSNQISAGNTPDSIPLPRIKSEYSNRNNESNTCLNVDPISDVESDVNEGDLDDGLENGDALGNHIDHSSSPTIPVDSPSMHVLNESDDDTNIFTGKLNNSIDDSNNSRNDTKNNLIATNKAQHQFFVQTGATFQEPPTFANTMKQNQIRPIPRAATHSFNVHLSNKIENVLTDFNLPSPMKRSKILSLLKDGLTKYTELLTDFDSDKIIETRSDYLVTYLKKNGYDLKAKTVNDYLAEIRNDKIDADVKKLLPNSNFCIEFKELLIESNKKRKCYNKKKNSKDLKKSNVIVNFIPSNIKKESSISHENVSKVSSDISSTLSQKKSFPNILPATSNKNTGALKLLPKEPIKSDVLRPLIIGVVRIGSLMNQRHIEKTQTTNLKSNFVSISDSRNISKKVEDESYIHKLKSLNDSFKKIIEDIYPKNLITHSLCYSKIPLKLDPSININLENDQMISYTEVILDISASLDQKVKSLNFKNSISNPDSNYSSIIQLKSITRIYDADQLIYRRCDPINGVFLKENSNMIKVILPLQAKLWSCLINDYHNGYINTSKFANLKISHTLYPNDDMTKFTDINGAIYSFIWDFTIDANGKYLPHCINVVKGLHLNHPKPFKSHSEIQLKPSTASPAPNFINCSSQQFQNTTPTPKLNISQSVKKSVVTLPSQQNNTSLSSVRKKLPLANTTNFPNFNNIFNERLMTATTSNILQLRGHKRTRSRSMNEIDLMSFTLPAEGSINMPYLDTFTPSDSTSSPMMSQNFQSTKTTDSQYFMQPQNYSNLHGEQRQTQNVVSTQTQQQSNIQYTPIQRQKINYPGFSSNHLNLKRNFSSFGHQQMAEFKYLNNSDSRLELNSYNHSIDETTANSMIMNDVSETSSNFTNLMQHDNGSNQGVSFGTSSPRSIVFPVNITNQGIHESNMSDEFDGHKNISFDTSIAGNNNTNNNTQQNMNRISFNEHGSIEDNWSKFTFVDNPLANASIASAPAHQSSFEFDDMGKDIALSLSHVSAQIPLRNNSLDNFNSADNNINKNNTNTNNDSISK